MTDSGMVKRENARVRGHNQSTDTKLATLLIDDALTFIYSGRVERGTKLLERAMGLLPNLGLDRQNATRD